MHFRKLLSLALPVLAGALSLHAAETRVIRISSFGGAMPWAVYDDTSPDIFPGQPLLEINKAWVLDAPHAGTILSPTEASQVFPAQTDSVMKAEAYLYAHYVSALQTDAVANWTHRSDPDFSRLVMSGPNGNVLLAALTLAGNYRIGIGEAVAQGFVDEALANSSTVDLNEFSFLTADIPASAPCDGCVMLCIAPDGLDRGVGVS